MSRPSLTPSDIKRTLTLPIVSFSCHRQLLRHSDDKFRSAMTRNHLTLKYSPSSGFLPSVALFIIAMSPKSVAICRIFINFVVSWELCPRHYIFDESVFAFILARKSDSFQRNEDNDNTHFLYSYVAMHFLCVHPYYPSVGSCIVYSFRVLSEPSCR